MTVLFGMTLGMLVLVTLAGCQEIRRLREEVRTLKENARG